MRDRRASNDPDAVDPGAVPPGNRPQKGNSLVQPQAAVGDDVPPPVHVYRHLMVDWFFSTLSEPAPTIRRILQADAKGWTLAAGAVFGCALFLNNAWMRRLGDDVNLALVLLAAFTLGPPTGVLVLHAVAALADITGKWLGGTAEHAELCAALGSGAAPQLLVLPLLLVGALGGLYSGGPTTFAFGLLLTLAGAWSIFICSATIAEVQRFPSAVRGFVNILLTAACAGALLFALVLGLTFFVDLLRPY